LIDFFFGEAYLGYSHIISKTPVRMASALEFIHTTEGWNFIDNWFMNDDGTTTNGSGRINSILFQYSFSLARAIWHPREYWGQARDLRFTIFGMFNAVESDDSDFDGATNRLKYGGDITYMPIKWLGIQARYDLVQPNLDNSTLSFHVLTGGLIFRTDFVSHEQIVLGYTHYFYGDNVTPTWPHENLPPDADIIKISAIMWW
jgi:hypothetical protein